MKRAESSAGGRCANRSRRWWICAACLLAGCKGRAPEEEGLLADYGPLPEFALTAQDGTVLTREGLAGKVWILAFIYTHCTLVCPRITAQMRKLQERIAPIASARLLSVTVDPDRDTPQVLAAYAALHHADAKRWLFLSGEKAMIRRMQVATQRHLDPDDFAVHSKQLYLVDGSGFVRGVYSVLQPGSAEELMRDLQHLLRNPAKPEPLTE